MNNEILNPAQLRKVLDYLYDGEMLTARPLMYIRGNLKPHYAHKCFLWLVSNKVKGKKLIEFYQNESNDIDGQGLLIATNYIFSRVYGRKLTSDDLD